MVGRPRGLYGERQKTPDALSSASEAWKILSSTARQLILWVLILVGAVMLYQFVVNKNAGGSKQLAYGELVDKIRNGQLDELNIKQSEVVSIEKGSKQELHTPIEGDAIKANLANLADEKG